jgi:hypothetical protein
MTSTPFALTPSEVNVWFAVLHLSRRRSAVTVRDLVDCLGFRGIGAVHKALKRLEFVTWEDGCGGTIRPLRRLEMV